MLVRRAGLYALGIVTSVAVGAGGARLFAPHERLADTEEQAGGSVQIVDPAVETPAEAAVTAPEADVDVDDADDPLPDPPSDRAEAPGQPPNDHSEWLKGYWGWNDQDENYTWVGGCWYDQYVVAPIAPPRARHERVRRAPSSAFVYTPGYWRYGGQKYSWVSGHYARKHAGYVYVAPRYVKVHGHWEWRTGAWVSEQEIALARARLARLADARRHAAHPTRDVAPTRAEPARATSWATGLFARQGASGASTRSLSASAERADVEQARARDEANRREEANRQEIEAARARDEAKQKEREEIEAKNEAAREARKQAREERNQRRAEAVERRREIEVQAAEARELDHQARQAHEAEVRDEVIREHARQVEANHEHANGFVHPGVQQHFGGTEISKPKIEPRQATPQPQTHVGARGAKSG